MIVNELIPRVKEFRKEHVRHNRTIEIAACDVHISVFERCLKRYKKYKHKDYIYREFYDADRKRIQFRDDGAIEDAFLQAVIQDALNQFWDASGLPEKVLVKKI